MRLEPEGSMEEGGHPPIGERGPTASGGSGGDRPRAHTAGVPPPELATLLACREADGATEAWSAFLERYTRLILHTVHSQANAHDGAMDRYAFVLQRLRDDDFRRLRQFDPDGPGRFSTWLVVVTRRLCEDFRRKKFGRPQSTTRKGEEAARLRFQMRRMLATLEVEEADWTRLADPSQENPDLALREAELRHALSGSVAELEPRDRLLLKLRFEYELTAQEIADLMGFRTQFHVYRRIRSRLSKLRDKLEAKGIDGARP